MRPSSSHKQRRAPSEPAAPRRSTPVALEFEPAVRAAARRVRAVLARAAPKHNEATRESQGRVDRWENELLDDGVVREFVELPHHWEKEQVLTNLDQAAKHMAHTAQLGVVQTPARIDLFRTHSLTHPPPWLEPLVVAGFRPRPTRVHALRGSSPPPRPSLPPPLSSSPHLRDEDEQREFLEQRQREYDEENAGGSPGSTYELGGRRLDRRIGLRAAARYGIDPVAFARGF